MGRDRKGLWRQRAVGLLVVGLAACGGDDGFQPPPEVDAGIGFRYSGDRSGLFTAEGTPVFSGNDIQPGTWAAAVSTDTGFVLVGSRAAGLPLVDIFFLTIPDPTVGGATEFGLIPGGVGLVAFDFDASVTLDPDSIADAVAEDDVYIMSEGTLVLETLTATRATGTVTGSGPRLDDGPKLFVEEGTFDVPVVDVDIAAARIPALARRLGASPDR
ncbi:MAG TPA: hypothetical protein VK837_05545 [Longimicrobiales bacterium]|nr:hypothetical protein [Longimicrobiales bacterium]